MTVRAMESPKHLYGWFVAKGYKFIVCRVSDLLQVPLPSLEVIGKIMRELDIGGAASFSSNLLDMIKACCPTGYLRIEIETLFAQPWCDMDLLMQLQTALLTYREIRRRLGYPEVVEDCDCNGSPRCRHCGGKGYTSTIVEMSETEIQLANGC